MRRMLVTGITGRSGRIFGEILCPNSDWMVTALVRDKDKFNSVFGEQQNLSCKVCDLHNEDMVKNILESENIDTVFHIAGIKYSVEVIRASISAKCVKRVVLVHTTGIYSKYKAAGAEYKEIEQTINELTRETDIAITILRPTMIYGTLEDSNVSKFIKMVDGIRLFPLVKGGKYELQPVNYEDLGRAYYQVLLNEEMTKNKNYILSGGSVVYLKDMLMSISEMLGKKTFFFSVPFSVAYMGAWVLYMISFSKCDYRERVQRLVEPRAYAYTEAQKDFGYSPMNFLEGLEKEVESYKERKSFR